MRNSFDTAVEYAWQKITNPDTEPGTYYVYLNRHLKLMCMRVEKCRNHHAGEAGSMLVGVYNAAINQGDFKDDMQYAAFMIGVEGECH